MDRYTRLLQRGFVLYERMRSRWSERWRKHANRRTILVLLLAGSLGAYAWIAILQAPEEFPVGELVTVRAGASLTEIAEELRVQGVIRSPLAFRAMVTLYGRERGARAGDYVFKEPTTLFGVARAIAIGAFGLEPIRIRIPEGATVREMVTIFGRRLERFKPEEFLPLAEPKEGYLFPDTYFFLPNTTAETVYETMRQGFELHVTEIAPQIASSTRSFSDLVKMASIIEREARNSADRRLISGVLWNRIDRGMPLQVDVTFLYTEGKGTFQITTADLIDKKDPYNTYVHKGLPPTPIGSPSLDSLIAAAQPTKTKYLYYLADKNGVTHFSATYEEHLRKKRLYIGT